MPVVRTLVSLHDLEPLSVAFTRDVDDCIEETTSDYGFLTHIVTVARDPVTKRVLSTDHTIQDA